MIVSGEKKEEYREIKPYWTKRLKNFMARQVFDVVEFRNGYSKNAPKIMIETPRIKMDFGKEEWGAEVGKVYYVIELGNILETSKTIDK